MKRHPDSWWIEKLWANDGRTYKLIGQAIGIPAGTIGREAARLGFRRGFLPGSSARFTSGPCVECHETCRADEMIEDHRCDICAGIAQAPEPPPPPPKPGAVAARALAKLERGEALTLAEERALHLYRMELRAAGLMRKLPGDVRTVTRSGQLHGHYTPIQRAG